MNNKIPRIIHQVWIGDPNKKPVTYMDTWKMKDWKYMLWDEKQIDAFDLENRDLYEFYYKRKNYHGASDVVRIEVLARFGGFYIDADTERLEDIDELRDCEFTAVEANRKGRIANGIMGAVPEHPILTNYIEKMGEAIEVLPPWSTIGGTLFTECINSFLHKQENNGVQILEPHTFYPHDSKGNPSRTEGKVYARHVWGTTHRLYGKI